MGWFGGSFDPPHRGHVAVARGAAEAYGLEVVVWGPTGRQPLKGQAGAGYRNRLAMVGMVCEEDGRFRVSGLDGPREDGEANYTVDTLEALREEYAGAELYGIVGMDAYRQMGEWREADRVRRMAEWVVVTRPGYAAEGLEGVRLLETVWEDVSATRLRKGLRAGADCTEWVGERVMRYITEHGLYRG